MKLHKVEEKVMLFKDIKKGECFRVAKLGSTDSKVFMKIWNSAALEEHMAPRYGVDLETGDVSYFSINNYVVPCVMEAREVGNEP